MRCERKQSIGLEEGRLHLVLRSLRLSQSSLIQYDRLLIVVIHGHRLQYLCSDVVKAFFLVRRIGPDVQPILEVLVLARMPFLELRSLAVESHVFRVLLALRLDLAILLVRISHYAEDLVRIQGGVGDAGSESHLSLLHVAGLAIQLKDIFLSLQKRWFAI